MKCLILFSCVLALACGHPQGIVNDPNVRQQIDNTPFRLKDSINSFDQKIFSKLAGYEQGNIVYSPFSLHMLLSQAYAGAPTGTPTSQELANLLALKPEYNRDYLYNFLKVLDSQSQLSKEPGTTVEIANKLYVAKDLTVKQPFKQALQTFYNSDIQSVDFKNPEATVDIINKFVNDKTKGLIDKILEADSLDGLSRMVMVNAIYFKGEWKNQFEPEDTQNYKFNVDKNRQVREIQTSTQGPGALFTKLTCCFDVRFGYFLVCNIHNLGPLNLPAMLVDRRRRRSTINVSSIFLLLFFLLV
jgi:serine protease inhibitor